MSSSNGNTDKSKVIIGGPATADEQLQGLGGGNLNQVQDLLFGNQLREIEYRFGLLEEKVHLMEDAQTAALKKAVDTLETRIATERDEHSQALKRSRRQHDDAMASLRTEFDKQSRELSELTRKMDSRNKAIEEDIEEARKVMGDKLDSRAKGLNDDISRVVSQVNSTLDQAVDRLHDQKVDRAALSEWMMEMALRLTNQGAESSNRRAVTSNRKPAPLPSTNTRPTSPSSPSSTVTSGRPAGLSSNKTPTNVKGASAK